MTKLVLKEYDPIQVIWEDAYAQSNNFQTGSEIRADYRPYLRTCVGLFAGWVKRDGREALIVVMHDDRNGHHKDGMDGPLMVIPKAMVVSVKRLVVK